MPVVINEVEILPAPEPVRRPPEPAPSHTPPPMHEQLRLLLRDLDGRSHRRRAD